MAIDKVALHGTPIDDPGTVRMHPVRPYEGDPHLTVSIRIDRMGLPPLEVAYIYLRTDDSGIPHYRAKFNG